MSYTVKTEAQTNVGNLMQIVYHASGTGSTFTITPQMRVVSTAVYNVTIEDQQADTTCVGASGVYTITPTNANDTCRVTFTGLPSA